VRSPRPADANGLAALIKRIVEATPYYPTSLRQEEQRRYSAKDVRLLISDPRSLVLLALEEERIAGFAVGTFVDRVELDLDWVGVDRASRRRGLASSLLAAVEQCAAQREVRRIVCEINPLNGPSRAMLVQSGYKPTGRTRTWAGVEHQEWSKELASTLAPSVLGFKTSTEPSLRIPPGLR
jgi:ribosomal protein S18 acetylase RimI-like enzyme